MFLLSNMKPALQILGKLMHPRAAFEHARSTMGELKQPQAEGQTPSGLVAYYGLDSASTPAAIRDISSIGVVLNTQENLPLGRLVNLKLLKAGEAESSAELEIPLQAEVAALEEGGAALKFVLPPSLNPVLWEVLLRNIVNLTDPDQVVEALRTLHTALFLCRLCPSGAEEAILLLGGQLDQDRTATLFKIARAAEDLLAREPDGGRMRAHPKLVANILRDGSWAPDELAMQLWVGLFVSSCSVDGPDDSNQILVDLLVHITATEAGILTHACERALRSAPGPANSASASIVLTPDEIVKLTGIHDLTRNATDLAYLFNLGLIQKVFDFSSYVDMDSFDITPSTLGLELYKHCHGARGRIDPQLVEAAKEHLAVFLPPPIPSVFENITPLEPDSPPKS
jgi:hypothetical protein